MYATEPIYVMVLAPPLTFENTTTHLETYHSDPDQLLGTMSARKNDYWYPRSNTHFENWDGFIQAVEPLDAYIHPREEELGDNEKRQAGILVKEGGQRMPSFRMTLPKCTSAVGPE
jgi:hypothetical protein